MQYIPKKEGIDTPGTLQVPNPHLTNNKHWKQVNILSIIRNNAATIGLANGNDIRRFKKTMGVGTAPPNILVNINCRDKVTELVK